MRLRSLAASAAVLVILGAMGCHRAPVAIEPAEASTPPAPTERQLDRPVLREASVSREARYVALTLARSIYVWSPADKPETSPIAEAEIWMVDRQQSRPPWRIWAGQRYVGPDPQWLVLSPDGSTVAFVNDMKDSITGLKTADGSTAFALPPGGGALEVSSMKWSPDSRRFGFIGRLSPGDPGEDVFCVHDLGDKRFTRVRRLAPYGFDPWCWDAGGKFAWTYVDEAKGTTPVRAGDLAMTLPPEAIAGDEYFQVAALRASPEGTHLAILGYGDEGATCEVRLYRIGGWRPVPGLRIRPATQTNISRGLWSPDGKQIAFVLYTTDAAGAVQRSLRVLDLASARTRPVPLPPRAVPLAWCDDRGRSRIVMLQAGVGVVAVDAASGAVTRLVTLGTHGTLEVVRQT